MPVFLIYSVGKGLFKLWYFWTFALFEKQMQNNFVWIVRNIEAIRMLLKRITWIRFQFKLFAIFVYVYIVLIQFRPMPNEINDAFVDYFFVNHRGTKSANGCVLIFVYMTYTMLPVRLREALFGGILLSIVHVYLSSVFSLNANWSEVISLKIHMEKLLMYNDASQLYTWIGHVTSPMLSFTKSKQFFWKYKKKKTCANWLTSYSVVYVVEYVVQFH